jgi:hypothetical protein
MAFKIVGDLVDLSISEGFFGFVVVWDFEQVHRFVVIYKRNLILLLI